MSIASAARVCDMMAAGTSCLLKKCPVAPVSAMVFTCVEGGPKVLLSVVNAVDVFSNSFCLKFLLDSLVLGSPRPHVEGGVERGGGRTYI